MPIITLTTDLGLQDHYVAAVKGAMYQELPDLTIVDVSHQIAKFDVSQAAFVLRNAYSAFPEGSIHILSVKPMDSDPFDLTALEYKGHFFIGADNGAFSLMFEEQPTRMVHIELGQTHTTFPTRDVFAKAACHLARGGTLELLGARKTDWREVMRFEPLVDDARIRGTVQYIDSFGNLITNIRKEVFDSVRRSRRFSITFRSPNFAIHEVHRHYTDVLEGDLVAVFGENGFLEVAIHAGPADSLLGLRVSDTVTVEFHDH